MIDQDELEAALAAHVISRAQYELAWREAETITAAIADSSFALAQCTRHYLKWFGS